MAHEIGNPITGIACLAQNLREEREEDGELKEISGQILGNFGGADRGIPAEDVKKFGGQLTQYGKLGDIKIYEGAGHAFMNPNNKQGYNAEAAQDAWGRIDRFFGRTLRATISNS